MDAKIVFERYGLTQAKEADDGTSVLSSYSGGGKRVSELDLDVDGSEVKRSAAHSSVWTIPMDNKPVKVTGDTVSATNPCISSNGKYIAFSGSELDATSGAGVQQLFLLEVKRGILAKIRIPSKGVTAPLFWENNTLAVFTGYYESMGGAEVRSCELTMKILSMVLFVSASLMSFLWCRSTNVDGHTIYRDFLLLNPGIKPNSVEVHDAYGGSNGEILVPIDYIAEKPNLLLRRQVWHYRQVFGKGLILIKREDMGIVDHPANAAVPAKK